MAAKHSSIDIRTDQIKVWQNDKVVTRLAQNGCFEEYPTKTHIWLRTSPLNGHSPWPANTSFRFDIARLGNMRFLTVDRMPLTATSLSDVFSAIVPVDSEDVPVSMQSVVCYYRINQTEADELYLTTHGMQLANDTDVVKIARLRVSPCVLSVEDPAIPNAIMIEINPYVMNADYNGVAAWEYPRLAGWEKIVMTYEAVGSADPTPLS